MALSGACGGARRTAPATTQPGKAQGAEPAVHELPSVPQALAPSGESQGAPRAAGGDGCATGGLACAPSQPYCCRILEADGEFAGRSECVAGYVECKSMEFACTLVNHRCPDTQGIVAIGCADDDPSRQLTDANGEDLFSCAERSVCRCEFRFLHNDAYHEEKAP